MARDWILDKWTPWQLLGLEQGASIEEVKEAFRFLSRKFHPDSSGDSETARRFAAVLAAYRALEEEPLPEFALTRLEGLDLFALGHLATEGDDRASRRLAIRKLGYSGRSCRREK